MGLVAANDLILRPLWPSWWTGKLSDIGVLFFLPLLLTALLSFVLPRREKLAAVMAFGGVLAAFLLLKASSVSNAWLTALLPIRAVADPTDLLTLPALAAAWLFWHKSMRSRRAIPAYPMRWDLLVLPLAALVTLADAAAPLYGVGCITLDGGKVNPIVSGPANNTTCPRKDTASRMELTSSGGIRYRVIIGESVERSADGQTWEMVYTATQLSEAELAYLHKTLPTNIYYVPGPLDAQIDLSNGSLVVAMGLEGVLVVPEKGLFVWEAVGIYSHAVLESSGLDGYLYLLAGEIWLAVGVGLLWLATALLHIRRAVWQIVLTVIGWILIATAVVALDPGLANSSYTSAFSALAESLAIVWALALAILALVRARKHPKHIILPRALTAPAVAVVILLPYAAWSLNLLAAYSGAQICAAVLGLSALACALLWKVSSSHPQQPAQDEPRSEE